MTEGGPSPNSAAPEPGPRLAVDVVRHDEAWAQSRLTDAMLEGAACAALAAASLPPGNLEVTIVLTGDQEMRTLNRTWRGKDAPTNVLSFPADAAFGDPRPLGDIVLAYETALMEARETRVALSDHVSHLVVHGVLHLLGFDHAGHEDAERMEALERRALAILNIADPYAEEVEASASELSS